jgi:hypothetical protein
MSWFRNLVLVMLLFPQVLQGQLISAVGIAAGITYGKQHWSMEEPYTYESYLLGINGTVMAELFSHPIYRWRIEAEYNRMGTKEVVVDTKTGSKYTNATTYISLNNYLKIMHEYFNFIPYVLIGPRLEYLFMNQPQVYENVADGFSQLHVLGSLGIGAEKVCFSRLKPFIEAFYNFDFSPSYSGTTAIYGQPTPETIHYRGYELRIGLKYVFDKGSCPAVINPAGI